MLFQNYGLFWRADRVGWGTPGKGNQGTLLGHQLAKENPIDFRQQRGVYALYDDSYRILYVGQAGYGNARLYNRLHNHLWDHLAERWQRFSWFGIDPVIGPKGTRYLDERDPGAPQIDSILNHLEAILIAAAEPALNRQGGKFGDAQQFRQHWEEDEEADLQSEIQRLGEQIDELSGRIEKK
jgi:hypothetical protein